MSSNIQVKRICQHCGKEFTARTTVTKCCSDRCAKAAYKVRIKNLKVSKSDVETETIKLKPVEILKAKEYLTVKNVASLLGCSIRAVYNMIGQGRIKATNLSERKTIVRRSDIDSLFEMPAPQPVEMVEPVQCEVSECYTMKEVQDKYGISEKALYELINREGIPKFSQGIFSYVSKIMIDKLLN